MKRSLLAILALAFAAAGCVREPPAPTPCDGFRDRTSAIEGREYRPCAKQILVELDSLNRYLSPIMWGDTSGWPAARTAYRRARRLIRNAGIDRDIRSRNDLVVQRWPSSTMRTFNVEVSYAAVQWMSALGKPNRGNYEEGRRHYDNARRLYGSAW